MGLNANVQFDAMTPSFPGMFIAAFPWNVS
jgi:hypothetical protein